MKIDKPPVLKDKQNSYLYLFNGNLKMVLLSGLLPSVDSETQLDISYTVISNKRSTSKDNQKNMEEHAWEIS